MTDRRTPPRRPAFYSPEAMEAYGGQLPDPAVVSEIAHETAQVLVHTGRASEDPEVTARLVTLVEDIGLSTLAELWAQLPARSLPGALWRLYALRSSVQADPVRMSRWFAAGHSTAQVSHVVAGVADPPGAEEIQQMADTILKGAWTGDFDVALERFAAFCRVAALGRLKLEDHEGLDAVRGARKLERTAEDLEAAARSWRHGSLD